MKEQFDDFPNMKVEFIPNFYDKDLENKLKEKETNKINLVYLSNIICSKGIFELIDAFERLNKKYDNICLNIAGRYMTDECMSIDQVKQKLNSKVSKNDKINCKGAIFGEEKVKLLQSSDIFVLPSYYKSEAFPISIIEAMVCKNAIVTTNYKYLPNVVNEQNGVLVEPRSVESLTEGIESLIVNEDRLRTTQEHNKKEAKEKYSLDKYIDNLNRIVLEK